MLLAGSTTASAAVIEGSVSGWTDGLDCEVWLTDSLDLVGRPPAAVAAVEDGRFRLNTGVRPGEGWLFLRQRGKDSSGAPYQLFMPLSLEPFELQRPPERVNLPAAPPDQAGLRASGQLAPDWWLVPSLLTLFVLVLAGFGRRILSQMLRIRSGATTIQRVVDGGEGGPGRSTSPLRSDVRVAPMARTRPPVPPSTGEGRALGLILALAGLIRLPRLFGGSLDLLEHTYGPGTARVGGDESLMELLFTAPSVVEVTHPPLYHLLLMLMGALSPEPWLIRLPAFLASLGTVYLLWRLFRRFHPTTGLAAAATFGLCAPAIHFGADATPYALVGLVLIASIALLIRALESGRAAHWRAWMGLLTLGFLCHYVTAIFGLAQILALAGIALSRLRSDAWAGALHRALSAGLLFAPLPLAWAFVHFAWFDAVALDTRLFADTYPSDPGFLPFLGQFLAVACGLDPQQPLDATTIVVLAAVGLTRWSRANRAVGMLVLACLVSFILGTAFLHYNLVSTLGDRIFWGFRWVAWAQPLLLGLAALALFPRHPKAMVRLVGSALAAYWLFAAISFSLDLDEHSARPDHRAVAETLLAEVQDRDAITVLPTWGQRGPITHHLALAGDGRFGDIDGTMAWSFGGRRVFMESTDEGLPFESSLSNSHFERVWILDIDERMFGRSKFSAEAAQRAIQWAVDTYDEPIPKREFTAASLRLLVPPREALTWSGRRTLHIQAPEIDIGSTPWLEPNMPGCDRGGPGGEERWRLNIRVPVSPGMAAVEPEIRNGEWRPLDDPGHVSGLLIGGSCSQPPPEFWLHPKPAGPGLVPQLGTSADP